MTTTVQTQAQPGRPAAAPPADLTKALTRAPRSLWRDAWARLLHNKAAVAGAIMILFFMFVAVFAPVLAPHNPPLLELRVVPLGTPTPVADDRAAPCWPPPSHPDVPNGMVTLDTGASSSPAAEPSPRPRAGVTSDSAAGRGSDGCVPTDWGPAGACATTRTARQWRRPSLACASWSSPHLSAGANRAPGAPPEPLCSRCCSPPAPVAAEP